MILTLIALLTIGAVVFGIRHAFRQKRYSPPDQNHDPYSDPEDRYDAEWHPKDW